MLLPAEMTELHSFYFWRAENFRRCLASKRGMHSVMIVVVLELFQLSFKILGVPEQEGIKPFASNSANQSLNNGM